MMVQVEVGATEAVVAGEVVVEVEGAQTVTPEGAVATATWTGAAEGVGTGTVGDAAAAVTAAAAEVGITTGAGAIPVGLDPPPGQGDVEADEGGPLHAHHRHAGGRTGGCIITHLLFNARPMISGESSHHSGLQPDCVRLLMWNSLRRDFSSLWWLQKGVCA